MSNPSSEPILFAWLDPHDCQSFNDNHEFSPILFAVENFKFFPGTPKFAKAVILTSCPEGMIYAHLLANQVPEVEFQVHYVPDSLIFTQMAKTKEVVKVISSQYPESPLVFCLSSGGTLSSFWLTLKESDYPQAQLIQISQSTGVELVELPLLNDCTTTKRDYLLMGVFLTIVVQQLFHFLDSCLTAFFQTQ